MNVGRFRFSGFLQSSSQWFASRLRKYSICKMATLETLHFDNLALRSIPLDEEQENYVRQVPGACFSLVDPTPVRNPVTVAYSRNALSLIDLSESELKRSEFAEYFSGNKLLPGSKTAAHCYCGHQFGHFSGQLGDGAAMYLGEVINSKGERWEIQLKGAGLTPYSRHADGRKVLRSSIREFLCSEAMHHLGIPTTRAGSCVTSDTMVPRDIYYDGNVIGEKASIVMRMAPTFIRFGSFEIFKPADRITGRKGPSVGRTDILTKLLDYNIKTFYTEIYEAHPSNLEDRYLAFYKEVVVKTAKLVAEWQCVGFCHGVLNTDNMSIVGLTIDYGPFGFMDYFDRDHICNESDADRGRYSYRAQPEICKWNLDKLAEAIQDALPLSKSRPVLEELYDREYEMAFMNKMRLKLGLLNKQLEDDGELIESLFDTMQETGADFTNTFRCLSKIESTDQSTERNQDIIKYIVSQCQTLEELKKTSQPAMGDRQMQLFLMLIQSNPHLLEQLGGSLETIQKEMEKKEKFQKLKQANPSEKLEKDSQLWNTWISKYCARLADDFKDCHDIEQVQRQRIMTMNANNPRFILRNYIAQNAISAAEKGDFSEVRRVLKLLERPYNDNVDLSDLHSVTQEQESSMIVPGEDGASSSSHANSNKFTYDNKPPDWSIDLRVT